MIQKLLINFSVCLIFFCQGCALICDMPRTLWGSSIRALEDARLDAVSRSYVCSFDECFDAVLSLGRNEKMYNPVSKRKVFDIFLKDRIRACIVVMGIKGNIDTTEVGIFFSPSGRRAIKVEVSSLSSTAKERVAEAVFRELSLRFKQENSSNH